MEDYKLYKNFKDYFNYLSDEGFIPDETLNKINLHKEYWDNYKTLTKKERNSEAQKRYYEKNKEKVRKQNLQHYHNTKNILSREKEIRKRLKEQLLEIHKISVGVH